MIILSDRVLFLSFFFTEQRLYWTDGVNDNIESIDLDLGDRRVHLSIPSGDIVVFGIDIYYNSIYFTDILSKGLFEVRTSGGDYRRVTFHDQPSDLRIYKSKYSEINY